MYAESSSADNSNYRNWDVVGQGIGYVARADDGKRDLSDLLAQQDKPIAASLVIDGPNWWIELPAEPDDQDDGCVLPF